MACGSWPSSPSSRGWLASPSEVAKEPAGIGGSRRHWNAPDRLRTDTQPGARLAAGRRIMTSSVHTDLPVPTATKRLRRTLEGVLGVPGTEGNRIDVLRNGDQIFPALFDAAASARHTIDFLTYVYWRGQVGTELARILADRAEHGVRVRVLLDGIGCRPIDHDLVARMEEAGVQVSWFRPPR